MYRRTTEKYTANISFSGQSLQAVLLLLLLLLVVVVCDSKGL